MTLGERLDKIGKAKTILGYTKEKLAEMSYEELEDLKFDITDKREGYSDLSTTGLRLDLLYGWIENAMVQAQKNTTYQVWVLGLNEDNTVNDYEKLIATFQSESIAKWFVNNYNFSKPTETPKAVVELEQVRTYPNGNEECEDIIDEFNL